MSLGSPGSDPALVAPYMFALMQRNVVTAGFVIADHNASASATTPGGFAARGCVLASPTWYLYPGNVAPVSPVYGDYVFNWTRDAAITASTVVNYAPAQIPHEVALEILANYVTFAANCQASGKLGQAKYTPEGGPTGASEESDGPALRVLTILRGFAELDGQTQSLARRVIAADLDYLVGTDRYRYPTVTHWEDTFGQSLFARAVQLRCLNELSHKDLHWASPYRLALPMRRPGSSGSYRPIGPDHRTIGMSRCSRPSDWKATRLPPTTQASIRSWACLCGDGIDPTDPRLLSTAAQVRAQWTDSPATAYPINAADALRGVGPVVGRYLGDEYDGLSLTSDTGHPWAVCTCSFAQLYYALAVAINRGASVPADALAGPFLQQVGVDATNTPADVVAALRNAGDSMLNAVIYHSNYLELSEQFDQATGFERSVCNLTWSYASFLSAVAARP